MTSPASDHLRNDPHENCLIDHVYALSSHHESVHDLDSSPFGGRVQSLCGHVIRRVDVHHCSADVPHVVLTRFSHDCDQTYRVSPSSLYHPSYRVDLLLALPAALLLLLRVLSKLLWMLA